jgi:hypothetical protein
MASETEHAYRRASCRAAVRASSSRITVVRDAIWYAYQRYA